MSKDNITLSSELLKFLALNSKFQRSDLRIYLFLITIGRPIYQRELIDLAKASWSELELHIDNPKCSGDFRAEVICRAFKNLIDLKLVKKVRQEGNNKFFEAETDIKKILNIS